MSSVPSRNMSAPAELKLAERHGYIVLDHAERPDEAHQLTQVAESYYAWCAANDRPYVAAILGPRKAEVTLDMASCSWVLCGACVKRLRAVIANYPDGPTQTLSMGPSLIRVAGLTRLGAPFLAGELINEAIDCRKCHGRTAGNESTPRMFGASRSERSKPSA